MASDSDLARLAWLVYTNWTAAELAAQRTAATQMAPPVPGELAPDDNDTWLAAFAENWEHAGVQCAGERLMAEGARRGYQQRAEPGATCDHCGPGVAAAVHWHGLDFCGHCAREMTS